MKSDNKNLILAVTLSMLILVLYQLYFTPPPPTAEQIAAHASHQTATSAKNHRKTDDQKDHSA